LLARNPEFKPQSHQKRKLAFEAMNLIAGSLSVLCIFSVKGRKFSCVKFVRVLEITECTKSTCAMPKASESEMINLWTCPRHCANA
jgi:hypothetical protein